MGSGAVGVEFASIFSRFGSDVTIVELLPRLVPVEDEAVSAELEKSFRKQGITCAHRREGDRRDGERRRRRHRRRSSPTARTQKIRADYLLVATGRGPVTTGLDAEGVGLQLEKGYIKVDAQYRTSVPGISAIGDVITLGTPGIRSSRTCRRPKGSSPPSGSPGRTSRPINYDHVPGCTYCDPEIGSVGLTEREAQERGYDVRIGTFPFGVLGRAKMAGETDGFVKIVADEEVRRAARRPHDRAALDRAGRRSDASRCGSSRRSKS